MAQRLKVLMSAYACEPGKGSEPEVGWQWALQMARFHDVTVVTRANNRGPIECALASFRGPKPQFIYYDLPRWLVTWKRHGFPVPLYYSLWQAGVRLALRKELRRFDLIHHVTFNSFRQPGFWWFCGKPVVLGPLGGGQICPLKFLRTFGKKALGECLRSLSVLTAKFLPRLYISFLSARMILVANADTRRRIPGCFGHKVRHMLETGIAMDEVSPRVRDASCTSDVKLLWVSRLEKIKAPQLALRAFAAARERVPSLTLDMIGDGPEGEAMKRFAVELNIDRAVRWHGRLPRAQVLERLAASDVFMFTSIRDTSGNALLEAMAAGLPAITLLHHGAAEIATDATAIRIPPTTSEETASRITEGIVRLAHSPDLRARLGVAARERIADVYAWDKKGEEMDCIYAEAVAQDATETRC